MFVQTNEDNRIVATSEKQEWLPDSFEFEFPEDFDFSQQHEYTIVDGVLEYSKSPSTSEYEERQRKSDARELMLDELPEYQADSDDSITALYEENLAMQQTIAEQDDAITMLYEMMLGGE